MNFPERDEGAKKRVKINYRKIISCLITSSKKLKN
jgi:hypothetical protein